MAVDKSSKTSFHHSSKEKHKPFKGSKKGKNAKKSKGRVEKKNHMKSNLSISFLQKKADRKNASKLAQKNKRNKIIEKNRIFTGSSASPKNVIIIPLSTNINLDDLLSKWISQSSSLIPSLTSLHSSSSHIYYSTKFLGCIHFIPCEMNLLNILKNALVADFVIFVASSTTSSGSPHSFDTSWTEQCHSSLKCQSISNIIPVLEYSEEIPNINEVKKDWTKYFIDHYGTDLLVGGNKVFSSYQIDDIERIICQSQIRNVSWRDIHPYICSVNYQYISASQHPDKGTLCVSGFIRGRDLNVNRPVHIVDIGDFSIEKLTVLNFYHSKKRLISTGMDEDFVTKDSHDIFPTAIEEDDFKDHMITDTSAPVHASENICNGNNMNTEITHNKANGYMRKKKNLPKKSGDDSNGVSDYQAAWLIGLEEDGDSSDDKENMQNASVADSDSDTAIKDISEDENLDDDDVDDMDDMKSETEDTLLDKTSSNDEDDMKYPDEVEVPTDQLAKERFIKYRGLKSFRYSDWDPNENLPSDYDQLIHNLDNSSVKSKELSDEGEESFSNVDIGQYVRIYLKDVPLSVIRSFETNEKRPLILFGLLNLEKSFTVSHFSISRYPHYEEPIKSKEPFLLCLGFRRYMINPLFSDLSKDTLHKLQKYIHHGSQYVGSIYSHVQFGQPPALLFKSESLLPDSISYVHEPLILCSTGTLLSMDPQRLIIKRITLTGNPFKIHKNSAVIREMFWDPIDVNYFRSVPIVTRNGRHGHIKMSLGTHGYMKCLFDKPIQQQDVVCMHLYKRVFPKWASEPYGEKPKQLEKTSAHADDMM